MITPEFIAGATGALLSLGFSYIPGLREKYAAKSEQTKKLTMLLMMAGVTVAAFGLACANLLTDLLGYTLACDRATGLALIRTFGTAAIANQTTFLLTPQTQAVKVIKAEKAAEELAAAIQEGQEELYLGRG